jgi:hypothetical protein
LFLQANSELDSDYFGDFPGDLEQEVRKHLQLQVSADFSVLDLELHLPGFHVYGAIVLYLLGMHRIFPAVRILKVVLIKPQHRHMVR